MALNSIRPQAAANREAARRDSGQFGEQQRRAPDEGLLNFDATDEYVDEGNGLFLHFTKPISELTPDEVSAHALTLDDEDLDDCIYEASEASRREARKGQQSQRLSYRYDTDHDRHTQDMDDSKAAGRVIGEVLRTLEAEKQRRWLLSSGHTNEHAAALDEDAEFRKTTGESVDSDFAVKLASYEAPAGEERWRTVLAAEFKTRDGSYRSFEHSVLAGGVFVGRLRGPLRAMLPGRFANELEEMVVRKHFGSFSNLQETCQQNDKAAAQRILDMIADAELLSVEMRKRGHAA